MARVKFLNHPAQRALLRERAAKAACSPQITAPTLLEMAKSGFQKGPTQTNRAACHDHTWQNYIQSPDGSTQLKLSDPSSTYTGGPSPPGASPAAITASPLPKVSIQVRPTHARGPHVTRWPEDVGEKVAVLVQERIEAEQFNEEKWEWIQLELAKRHGITRSATAIKNYWGRKGRAVHGIDERRAPNPDKLVTSVQSPEDRKRRRDQAKMLTEAPPRKIRNHFKSSRSHAAGTRQKPQHLPPSVREQAQLTRIRQALQPTTVNKQHLDFKSKDLKPTGRVRRTQLRL